MGRYGEDNESPYVRGHLASSGYEYSESRGCWWACFENKIVVARKDYPKSNIKKGEKYRFVKCKIICDDTGISSWETDRVSL